MPLRACCTVRARASRLCSGCRGRGVRLPTSTPALAVRVLVQGRLERVGLLRHLLDAALPDVALARAGAHHLHPPLAVHLLADALQAGQHILQLPRLPGRLAIQVVHLRRRARDVSAGPAHRIRPGARDHTRSVFSSCSTRSRSARIRLRASLCWPARSDMPGRRGAARQRLGAWHPAAGIQLPQCESNPVQTQCCTCGSSLDPLIPRTPLAKVLCAQ